MHERLHGGGVGIVGAEAELVVFELEGDDGIVVCARHVAARWGIGDVTRAALQRDLGNLAPQRLHIWGYIQDSLPDGEHIEKAW